MIYNIYHSVDCAPHEAASKQPSLTASLRVSHRREFIGSYWIIQPVRAARKEADTEKLFSCKRVPHMVMIREQLRGLVLLSGLLTNLDSKTWSQQIGHEVG